MPHNSRCSKSKDPINFAKSAVTPHTFDKLREKIEHDPVFFNNSNNAQIPVEEQLAIALYRFGHDGNAASQASVGLMGWRGKGSPAITPNVS